MNKSISLLVKQMQELIDSQNGSLHGGYISVRGNKNTNYNNLYSTNNLFVH